MKQCEEIMASLTESAKQRKERAANRRNTHDGFMRVMRSRT